MITAAEASARILERIHRMPAEQVPLHAAHGSITASDIVATVTHPPWNNSSMDGYAVRSADLTTLPCRLRVVGGVVAGAFPENDIGTGEAMRVMTGAPIPASADTVIRFEDTDSGTSVVEIRDGRDLGKNVRPRGEDYSEGDVLLPAGHEVSAAAIGVLASTGISTVRVFRRPTVGIVSSGDELVMLDRFDAVRRGERIVSSNSYTLPALVREAGGVPLDFGIAEDSTEAIQQKIEAARGCDLIITTAGVSVGEHDYTRHAMEQLGAELDFWKVRIRPGAPMAFGTLDGTPWIGLSGNPVSAMVTFELFVHPAIRKMRGCDAVFPTSFRAQLETPVTTSAPLTHFLRAVTYSTPQGAMVRQVSTQSTGALSSLVRANALLVVPHDRQQLDAGETVTVIPFGTGALHTHHFPL